jgi:putative hydrolase of the HAD superfamily
LTTWILLDYGEVISLPQPADDIAAMEALADLDHETFQARYWRHRDLYDRGFASHAYWSKVVGRVLAPDDPVVTALNAADVTSWSHLDPAALRMIEEFADNGHRLALLSNAPEPMATAIDQAPWAGAFNYRFYSCRFGLAKPDIALFQEVLLDLDVAPADVTFLDDRAVNVRAAASLGINAVLYRAPLPPHPISLFDLIDASSAEAAD